MDEVETKVNELIEKESYKEALKYLYRQKDKNQGKERAEICELIARVYRKKKNCNSAFQCLMDACVEYDSIGGIYKYADSFIIDGDHYLKKEDFSRAKTMYEIGLQKFPDEETLKLGLKNAIEMAKKSALLMGSKLVEEEEQKNKGGPKINEGKVIQKKKGESNKDKEKLKEVEKQEKLIREEKQEKILLIQEESQKKKGGELNSGKNEVKRMSPKDFHNQCKDNVNPSDSTTFTVTSKITLFANSCRGMLESDFNDPVAKSFLTPTTFQVENFSVLHTLCSSDRNLLNVENVIRDREKTDPLLVTEPVETLESFFNNELKKVSSCGKVTKNMWWDHIASMFRQIFRDYSRGILFLFTSSVGFCGDLSFNMFVTNERRGKILPSLKSEVNQRLDVTDWVNEMIRVIFLPFKKDVEVNSLDDFAIPFELKKLLQSNFCTKYKISPGIIATFLVDHPFFWTKQERVDFIIKLKALLKIYPSSCFNVYMDCFVDYSESDLDKKLYGVYAAIYAKGNSDQTQPLAPDTFSVRKYEGAKDIVRFCGSVYTHCNDTEYKSFRGKKVLSVDEVENDLNILFPKLYIDMYDGICNCLSG